MRKKHLPRITTIIPRALLVFAAGAILSCSSEAQLEQQRKEKQRIEALKQASTTIIGKWRDENSVVEFFPDGSVTLLLDDEEEYDSKEFHGTWTITGDILQLTFEENNATINAKILEISPTRYRLKYPRRRKIYDGKRIE
jgi:hypothetical protein